MVGAAIQADLAALHARLAAGDEREITPRVALALCLRAVAEMREGVETVLAAALAEIDERPEAAAAILESALTHLGGRETAH